MRTFADITIDELIRQGKAVLEQSDYEKALDSYTVWKSRIQTYAIKNGFSRELQDQLKVRAHFVRNEFSETESIKNLKNAVKDVLLLFDNWDMQIGAEISDRTAKLVIERILSHVNIFWKSMYQDDFHQKCTFPKSISGQAKIKNEYDIQHILYALLRTVFPETRKEVNGDNGYSGTRADLYLETYDIIIEIKCTRSSMSVKQLREELGSDAFHYKTKNLYLFIYDKEDIIKNPEAYQNAFQRDYEKDGKNVQVFITKTLI